MDQRHRRLDGVQVHSAKGDISGQTAMEEEDTGMVSCCRQPSEQESRVERERERERERESERERECVCVCVSSLATEFDITLSAS